MGTTTNLNLITHTSGIDLNESFEDFRMDLNGDTTTSNMALIDVWAGTIPILLSALSITTSGSVSTYDDSLALASGCITIFNSGSTDVEARFEKLDEFSGSGQADFNNISQEFSHLLILGTASVNRGVNLADVGCDFNEDSGSSNYKTFEWIASGSGEAVLSGSSETFQLSQTAQILLGNVSGSIDTGYGGTFFSIIPNYSASSGFFKTSMGFSSGNFLTWVSSMKSGGYWSSNCPITRIRVFGSDNTTTRYDFLDGTIISLYGLE